MKIVSIIMALLLVCFPALFGCSKKQPVVTLRYDLTTSPGTLDPQYATSSAALSVIENTFEGLTAVSPSGEVLPACAKEWKISADRLTYSFTLKDDLKWGNGDPLKAEDFVFALRRLFNADAPAPNAGNYMMIKNAEKILAGELPVEALGVTAKGDKTVEITLEHDDPSLLTELSNASAMPCQQKFFVEQKGRYGLAAENLMCNGPFSVGGWNDNLISVKKNIHYRKNIAVDNVEFYVNRGDPVALYLAGKSDIVFVPFQRLSEAEGLVGEAFYDQSWMLVFNTGNMLLSSREIRASLTAAMDKEALLERLPETLKPYQGIIAPSAMLWGSSYRDLAPIPQPAMLPANTRQTFLEALSGLGLNDTGRLTLLVSDFAPGPDLGGAIQRRWQQELSVFINMEQLDYYELIARVENKNFDMAIVPLTAQGSSPVDFLSAFETLEIVQSSEEFSLSELISRARQQTEPNAAAAQLFMAEQKLVDECVAVPLFIAPSLFATREGVTGVSYSTISRTVYFADASRVR